MAVDVQENPQQQSSAAAPASAASADTKAQIPAFVVPARSDRPSPVDALERGHYVRALASLIGHEDTEVPLTIGVYSPWGGGKSSFLEQLRRELSPRFRVLHFNPWRHGDTQQIWAELIRRIGPLLDQQLSMWERLRFVVTRPEHGHMLRFRKRAVLAAKKMHNWLIAGPLAGASIFSSIDQLPERLRQYVLPLAPDPVIAENMVLLTCGLVALLAGKICWSLMRPFSTLFEAYTSGKQQESGEARTLTHTELNKIAGIIQQSQKRGARRSPVVILLDDLDRCPPDRIVEVLEAVNLFLVDLPFITVLAVDSTVARRAVADRYSFMLPKRASHIEQDEYGRRFLEKIIHIPFQIPPARRYEEYVEQLITRRDKEKEEAAEKTRRSIRVFHAAEALRMRQGLLWKLLYPLYPMALLFDALGGWMLRDMPERDRRLTALYNRLQLGLPLTQQQQQWLATQDYRTHETIRFIREQHPGRLMLNPLLWTQAFTRASHEAQRRDVEIRGEDAELLRTFADDLRGNPRSIKRFINTYQLAKGIFAQLERENRDLPSLSSLAAWLVLLQNWPYEASKVYADLHGGSEVAVVLQQAGSDDELSQEFRSYVIRHTVLLSELPTSAGFEVAGCFSLVSPTAGPSQTLAGQ